MKKNLLLGLVTMLVLFIGCKKDEEKIEPAALSLKYGSTEWKAITISGQNTGTATSLNCFNGSQQLVISFSGLQPGTYEINDDNQNMATFINYSTIFSDYPEGEIVVTSYNADKKLISGTFHFKAENFDGDELTVTDGVFSNVVLVMN